MKEKLKQCVVLQQLKLQFNFNEILEFDFMKKQSCIVMQLLALFHLSQKAPVQVPAEGP